MISRWNEKYGLCDEMIGVGCLYKVLGTRACSFGTPVDHFKTTGHTDSRRDDPGLCLKLHQISHVQGAEISVVELLPNH